MVDIKIIKQQKLLMDKNLKWIPLLSFFFVTKNLQTRDSSKKTAKLSVVALFYFYDHLTKK